MSSQRVLKRSFPMYREGAGIGIDKRKERIVAACPCA